MYIDVETRNEIHRPVGGYYAVDGSLRDETWLTKNRNAAIAFFKEELSRVADSNERGEGRLFVITFDDRSERGSDKGIDRFTVSGFVDADGGLMDEVFRP